MICMNLLDITWSKISQSQKGKSMWFHLYKVAQTVKFMQTGGCGEGVVGRYYSMGTEFQFHQMSVPEMDGSDDFTTMGLHFYLKIFKIYYFCDYIIIHLFWLHI